MPAWTSGAKGRDGRLYRRPAPGGMLWGEEMVPMMFWYGAHWMFWQVGLMWFGMLVFWGLLIWGVYILVTNARRTGGAEHHEGDSRRILDERLARGDIDADEYRRLRDLINGRGPRIPSDMADR